MAAASPKPLDQLALFPLRAPFTGLSRSPIAEGRFVDFGIEIKYRFAGTLRVKAEDEKAVLLSCFTNMGNQIGILTGRDKVEWKLDPEAFAFTQVVDELGGIHDVRDLS